MNADKLKQFGLVVLVVFVGTAGPLFLANVTNVFAVPWATWQIVLSGGVFGVVTYAIAWALPQVNSFGIGSK